MPNVLVEADLIIRQDTSANWVSNNPVLENGQEGYETDTRKSKVGTGANWNDTQYRYTASGIKSITLTTADLGGDLNVVGTKLILTYSPAIIAIMGQKKPFGYPSLLDPDTGNYTELTPMYSQRDLSGNITAVFWDGYSGQQFYLDLIAP